MTKSISAIIATVIVAASLSNAVAAESKAQTITHRSAVVENVQPSDAQWSSVNDHRGARGAYSASLGD